MSTGSEHLVVLCCAGTSEDTDRSVRSRAQSVSRTGTGTSMKKARGWSWGRTGQNSRLSTRGLSRTIGIIGCWNHAPVSVVMPSPTN
ncbi:hypothetical protein BV22DRAFT_878625 [Leucogyrophana mollusca]|uniref:Uncharacterized protein n=1 Tax=Leucogyrophana mollusca TaxID=85980 RepID=A0ACB8B0M2_9AGAM|nr:hypothetical protein BV22DRAFT_878625 [Leucogyrophana mollusca]